MLYNPIIKAFKELDADMLERQIAWALDRVAALKEFKAEDHEDLLRAKELFGERHEEYRHRKLAKKHEIAGGKTWYNHFLWPLRSRHCGHRCQKRSCNH